MVEEVRSHKRKWENKDPQTNCPLPNLSRVNTGSQGEETILCNISSDKKSPDKTGKGLGKD